MRVHALSVVAVIAVTMIAFVAGGSAQVPQASPPSTKAIRFRTLVDGTGAVLSNAVVIVEGDRIKSVGTSLAIPANADAIDLSGYTGIPGMIDVHTHLAGPYGGPRGPNNGPAQVSNQALLRSPVIDMFLAQSAARKTLEVGITTVRNLGAYQFMDLAMRDLINMGAMVGPRMYVSGPGLRTSAALGVAVPEATADGPVEVTRIARRLFAAGVDHIKVFGSTSAGPPPPGRLAVYMDVWGGSHAAFTYDELKAVIDVAHSLDKKVAVHSYGPDGARDAVRAGADSIEHGLDMDDATLAEMARRGTFYVPTIYNNVRATERANPADRDWMNGFVTRTVDTVRRARKAGVKFAMGSDDFIGSMRDDNTGELDWFVKVGLTPAQALATATTNAAALLGKEKELGKIAPGYFADLVAVEGDPLMDINVVITKVRWVMKGGAVALDKTGLGKDR